MQSYPWRDNMKQKTDAMIAGLIRGFHIYNDAILGAFLALGSIFMVVQTYAIKIMKPPISPIDTARFFPRLVFGALIPIGLVLFFRGLKAAASRRPGAPEGELLADKVLAFKRSIIALLAIAVFIAGMEPIGYIPMAILYMTFNMFYMSEKRGWKPVVFIVVSVVTALLCYWLFRTFVYVRLPSGILKGVLG